MSDWTPDPQEKGWLDPPRRNPPTAVGVATPPPPRRPRRSHHRRSHLQRVARVLGVIGVGLLSGLTVGALAPIAGVTVAGVIGGASILRRLIEHRRQMRFETRRIAHAA